MGKRLLETTFPLLHLLSVVSPYCFWGRNHYLLAVGGPASQLVSLLCTPLLVVVCCFWGGQVALWGFHFHLSCFVCCCCCWRERAFEGDGVSFSQLWRLSFAFLLLYLFVVAGVDRLPSLGTTLDDGAKVTWNNLPSIAPLVYRYSFLFLRWNGFSLNKLWPIINYHLLLPRLHLMSCDYLLAVARPPSQLLPLLCSPLLVVVCPCLLFLGWTGCSFRDYSMRQRFFQVA